MKRKIFCLIGFSIGCALVVAGFVWQQALVLAEFNKQIEVFGYYKDDIHLLNQFSDYFISTLNIITGFIFSIWCLLSYILYKEDKR